MFLVGHHIGHSYSPAMWNHLFTGRGLDVTYGLRDVPADDLPGVRTELDSGDVVAANVTMPYKRWAAAGADSATVDVRDTGAANLLRPTSAGMDAANTDVVGARALLAMRGPYRRVTILGAGGTAAAISAALVGLTDEVTIVNRTEEHGKQLARRWAGRFGSIAAEPWERRNEVAAGADLVVNTVPVTALAPLAVDLLGDKTAIYDINYRERATRFQRQATARGLSCCDGLSHLAAQAIPMLRLLPLELGFGAAHVLVAGLQGAAGRSVRAWGSPLSTELPAAVVLTGFMATGKSAVAALLANKLGFDLVDTDQIIESRHGSIPDLFADQGEAAFRAMERAVVADLEDRSRVVIATGGGLMLDPDNASRLGRGARVFCLTADPDVIVQRIAADRSRARPMLDTRNPSRRVSDLLIARTAGYRRFVQVDTTDRTTDEVADRIAEMLWVG